MKRNWYAAIILLALCVLLFRAGQYVDRTTAGMQRQLEAAYALAEQGDYPAARRAYSRAANRALRSTQVLGLLVRRNILDQLNQTLAVLPPCAEADSLADLEMETQRACTQIEQVRQSFLQEKSEILKTPCYCLYYWSHLDIISFLRGNHNIS